METAFLHTNLETALDHKTTQDLLHVLRQPDRYFMYLVPPRAKNYGQCPLMIFNAAAVRQILNSGADHYLSASPHPTATVAIAAFPPRAVAPILPTAKYTPPIELSIVRHRRFFLGVADAASIAFDIEGLHVANEWVELENVAILEKPIHHGTLIGAHDMLADNYLLPEAARSILLNFARACIGGGSIHELFTRVLFEKDPRHEPCYGMMNGVLRLDMATQTFYVGNVNVTGLLDAYYVRDMDLTHDGQFQLFMSFVDGAGAQVTEIGNIPIGMPLPYTTYAQLVMNIIEGLDWLHTDMLVTIVGWKIHIHIPHPLGLHLTFNEREYYERLWRQMCIKRFTCNMQTLSSINAALAALSKRDILLPADLGCDVLICSIGFMRKKHLQMMPTDPLLNSTPLPHKMKGFRYWFRTRNMMTIFAMAQHLFGPIFTEIPIIAAIDTDTHDDTAKIAIHFCVDWLGGFKRAHELSVSGKAHNIPTSLSDRASGDMSRNYLSFDEGLQPGELDCLRWWGAP